MCIRDRDYIIRETKKAEYDLLNDFLYEAIYIPDGVEPPPKSIINCPELQEYVFEFGKMCIRDSNKGVK